jgi:ABC-type sugar transport system ATPase subunit
MLEVRSISKRFGAVQAVKDVSFAIHAGEVLGLIGDNGAGKSTIVNMIAGTYPPDSGQIIVDGEEASYESPAQARARGIETVYQLLNLVLPLDIAENVYLHRELRLPGIRGRRLGWIDTRRMRREVAAGLNRLDLHLPDPKIKVSTFPAAIVSSLRSRARCCGGARSFSSTSHSRTSGSTRPKWSCRSWSDSGSTASPSWW